MTRSEATVGAPLRALLLLPPLLVLALYWPATGHGWVWDDPDLLAALPGTVDGLWQAIWQPFLGPGNYLRPLPLLTLGLEKIFGASPFLAHLDNVLLHALNAALVTAVAFSLERRRGHAQLGSLLAGLVYALHPALTEAVAWVSVRPDLMMTSFCLLALLADLRLQNLRARSFMVALLFLAAALCKEMALGFALALPLWHLAIQEFRPARLRTLLPVYGGVFVVGLVYLVLRWLALGYLLAPVATAETQAWWLPLATLGRYAQLSLLPFWNLSPVHTLQPLQQMWPALLAGVLVLAALCAQMLGRYAQIAALAGCVVLSLLPVLNLLPLETGENYVHERFLVLPLAFLSLAPALWRWPERMHWQLLCGGAIGVWLALSALTIHATLPHWQGNLQLWTWAFERTPSSRAAQTNLHAALLEAGEPQQAHALAEAIRGQFPQSVNPSLENGDAMLLQSHGQPALAVSALEQALERGTALAPADRGYLLGQLGYLYLMQGRPDAARAALQAALDAGADPVRPTYFLGIAELALGDTVHGEAHLQQGLALLPEGERAAQERKARAFLAGPKPAIR